MEQMYMVEIFIDKVTIFVTDEDLASSANKKLIIKIKFGPKVQFIVKEGQLSPNTDQKDDIVDCDDLGRRKWSRTIRVGKSYLFPSYSDTVLMTLSKFPLEIEVWNDDENEKEIFVGIGTMQWHTEFFLMLKETADANKIHEPLSIKQLTTLYAECCCKQAGEITFILRVTALGDSIITEFQQLMSNPEEFVFRTNKAPSMFKCSRIEGDDPNFTMAGSIYETTTLENPDIFSNAQNKIEVCTELQSCGMAPKGTEFPCEHGTSEEPKKNMYPINKIRMGDITGPCGNTNCELAHRIRVYLRKLESYKKEAAGKVENEKGPTTSKVCGKCDCKDDKWHREQCPTMSTEEKPEKVECKGCGSLANPGHTCDNKKDPTNISFMLNTPTYMEAIYGKNYTVQNVNEIKYNSYQKDSESEPSPSHYPIPTNRCGCQKAQMIALQTQIKYTTSMPSLKISEGKVSARSIGVSNPVVNNIDTYKQMMSVYNCTDVQQDKDCKCNPPKRKPVCKAPDCECPIRAINKASRKIHKPYCPSFVHKKNCPVNEINEEDENTKVEEDEDESEPLPYGLPPIRLGPCPIMGRPCTVPDGFARMYKTAAMPPQPPSYSDAGKVCCSKEYARIKKALKEYMTHEKDNDFRCLNRYYVDTENRCCDKDQKLMSLTGKCCCAPHKISIQEKFKNEKK